MEDFWCIVGHLESGVMMKRSSTQSHCYWMREEHHHHHQLGGVGCDEVIITEEIVDPLTQGATFWSGAGGPEGYRKGHNRIWQHTAVNGKNIELRIRIVKVRH